MGGAQPQGISSAEQTVLARMMESQIWYLRLCGSVGEGSEKGQWPLSSSSHIDVRHFSLSQYATGAFQAATPVLELRGSESD